MTPPSPGQLPSSGPLEYIRIPFNRGIDLSQESSVLPAGTLLECQNWVPEPSGSLRVRIGWTKPPNDDAAARLTFVHPVLGERTTVWPTVKKVRGMQWVPFAGDIPPKWLIGLSNPDSGNGEIWARNDDFAGAGWSVVMGAGNASAADYLVNPVAFAKGTNGVLWTHPMQAKLQRWDGKFESGLAGTWAAPTQIDAMDRCGRAIAFHKDRFFVGGEEDISGNAPYRLFFSAAGSYTSWDMNNPPASSDPSWIDIGKDDATPIEDLASFNGLLFIGKTQGLFALSGAGPDSFAVNKIDGPIVGPGRTLIPTPAGLVILGPDQAWIYIGGPPDPISGPIEQLYAAGRDGFRIGAYCAGKVYISSSVETIPTLVWDTETGAWFTETVAASPAEEPASFASHFGRLGFGVRASGLHGPFNYRDMVGASQRLDDDLPGLGYRLVARTGQMWLTGPAFPFTLRHIYVKLRQRTGSAADVGLEVAAEITHQDGNVEALPLDNVSPKDAPVKVYRQRLDKGGTGYALALEFSESVPDSGRLDDIEDVVVAVEKLEAR